MQPIYVPLSIFLIGATGDLAKKKIYKALYSLFQKELLPAEFTVVGVARQQLSGLEYGEFIRQVVHPADPEKWSAFSQHFVYIPGDVTQADTFARIAQFHTAQHQNENHLWYVATLPQLYTNVVQNIEQVGLNHTQTGWTKILLEKPFGVNLESFRKLRHSLEKSFAKEQIYYMDHYLGKETVQNLLVFRFANGIFENLWNREFIDHIQITASETLGITGREAFYDSTGVVRDFIQNHVLQMLATTMMEQPENMNAHSIHTRRLEVLQALQPLLPEKLNSNVKLAQYTTGSVEGRVVSGYLDEKGIPVDSLTETAAALKCFVDNDRWRNVPIYLRAGKRMARQITEISIQFKEPSNSMFRSFSSPQKPNILSLRIGPNEGVVLRFHTKKPGIALDFQDVPMQFSYHQEFTDNLIEAYVKLIYDAIQGDLSLFPQADEVDASWQFIQPILDAQVNHQLLPEKYAAGTWGPASFESFLDVDKRAWISPSIDVCSLIPPLKG